MYVRYSDLALVRTAVSLKLSSGSELGEESFGCQSSCNVAKSPLKGNNEPPMASAEDKWQPGCKWTHQNARCINGNAGSDLFVSHLVPTHISCRHLAGLHVRNVTSELHTSDRSSTLYAMPSHCTAVDKGLGRRFECCWRLSDGSRTLTHQSSHELLP